MNSCSMSWLVFSKPTYLYPSLQNNSSLKHAILATVANCSLQPSEWERQITAKERDNP